MNPLSPGEGEGEDHEMDRVFWVKCPGCAKRFNVDWTLRHAGYDLICPFCQREFLPNESPELDERWYARS